MRILFDHQAFTGNKYGGVARYFHQLMTNLRKKGHRVRLSLWISHNVYLDQDPNIRVWKAPLWLGKKWSNLLFSQLNRLASTLWLLSRQYDLVHITFFHDYFLHFIGNKPFVLTYHDLIKEKFGTRYLNLDNANFEQKKKLLDRASAIIAVSHHTKQDLIDIFQIPAHKITVIHHACVFGKNPPDDSIQVVTPPHYFLYVGARNDYKNFPSFLQAFQLIALKYPEIQLICAGGGNFNRAEQKLIHGLDLQNRVEFRDFQEDEILYRLYQQAIAFVYPSLYEGFGIPILEAFAAQCPVLLSNASCFPEVAQAAALYFDPQVPQSIANQMERIWIEQHLRDQLIASGKERLKDFSQEKLAQQTIAVYQQVLQDKL